MLTVYTVKTGKRYGAEYVNKMLSMLKRHLHMPFKMVCLTDKGEGISSEVTLLEPIEVLYGWWNKMYQFQGNLFDKDPEAWILYLDLDQIITGDITPIVQECMKHPFSCYSDHLGWAGAKFGSAFMVHKNGAHQDLLETFWPLRKELEYFDGGDQAWIEQSGLLPEVFYFNEMFPDAVRSYRLDILPTGKPPDPTVKIVNFHGNPKPVNLKGIPWVKENWA